MKKMMIFALVCVVMLGLIVAFAIRNTYVQADGDLVDNVVIEDGMDSEEAAELVQISGVITEIADAYFVIEDALLGDVQVNFGEETVFEGTDAQSLEVGMYIFVDYNGMMTRSLPPQVYALRAYVHVLSGVVEEIADGSVTILLDETGEPAIIHLPENAPQIAVGDRIEASTNGAMTMSLPPQSSAAMIVVITEQE